MAQDPARVLSTRALNRALLARQLLLEPGRMAPPRALERIGGIQAQYAPSGYIGLWSRLQGFHREDLTRALERRSVVQATMMRATIHLVSAADYWPFTLAIRDVRRRWWLRTTGGRESADAMARTARRLRTRLSDGPMRRAEIEELVGTGRLSGLGLWLDMVRVPPSGTWERRSADLFAAAEDWIGPPVGTPDEGVELLIRRYLGAFGPAARNDVASFAGFQPTEMQAAIDRLGEHLKLRRFRDQQGRDLVDLPRAPLPDPETPAPVRFLPTWDATLLVHARRTGILAEEHRPKIFNTKTPHSAPTFLVDGVVAGTWRHEGGRIRLEPFGRLPTSTRAELDEEADHLAAFHA